MEHAEYGALLVRIGAIDEALDRLAKIDEREAPEALLYLAFAHFSIWEYQASIPLLERYIAAPIADYARWVGRTNLAFALAETRRHESALRLLEENIRVMRMARHLQLQSTCHVLSAQVLLHLGEFSRARAELSLAVGLTDNANTNDNFLATKWGLIADGLESKSIEPFRQLQRLAVERHSWASWRESDFYSLKIQANRERFVHLYFGSPFPEFRDLITRELGERPSQQIYVLGPKSAPRLDLRTGEIDGVAKFNPGGKLHQLLGVFLRDFYQHVSVAGLFSRLFPGEHFDVTSSPGRVHQVIWRLRAWIKDNKIPLALEEKNGFYSLRIDGQFSVRVPINAAPIDSGSLRVSRLKELYGEAQYFLAKDAQEKLGLSKASFHEFLQWAISAELVGRSGASNRSAIYQVLPAAPLRKVS